MDELIKKYNLKKTILDDVINSKGKEMNEYKENVLKAKNSNLRPIILECIKDLKRELELLNGSKRLIDEMLTDLNKIPVLYF